MFAAPFAEHLDNIALAWAGGQERGEYVAITTTTNDHVDAINHAVQDHRDRIGQLGDQRLQLDETTFCIGDVITTRHNQRLLRTTTGDSVRNRDYWTINAITDDGGLAVTRIDGHGTITLPPGYVAEHIQLGYAATEPGNQSDTAARSITLATPATTCRGLYVAVTRGRDENLICVATDTHDVGDAIDVLEQILASDRADLPATRTRRELAAIVPPAGALPPRCVIPVWFHDLRDETRRALADAWAAVEAERHEVARIQDRIDGLDESIAELSTRCAPHERAIEPVTHDLEAAHDRHRQAVRDLATSGRLHRRGARNVVADASDEVITAQFVLDELTHGAQPLLDQRTQLRDDRDRLQQHLSNERDHVHGLSVGDRKLSATKNRLGALDTWADWANGNTPRPAALVNAARHLHRAGGDLALLAEPFIIWVQEHDLGPQRSARTVKPVAQHGPRPERPGLEIGF